MHGRDLPGRVLLVCAHPDDETIGASSLLTSGTNCFVLHVTNGSPANEYDANRLGLNRVAYAEIRRRELIAAMAIAGIPEQHLLSLGIPDQEVIFRIHEVTASLRSMAAEIAPDRVYTHPYEGGHPDHDAVALAVSLALPYKERWEFTSYHAGPDGMETGLFLQPSGGSELAVHTLTQNQRQLKRAMIDCFESQRETLRTFRIDEERFRRAPDYDFSQPPHPGKLFYENFAWGVRSGAEWRSQF